MRRTAVVKEASNAIGIQSPVRDHLNGDLIIDLERRIVTADGKPIRLSGKEYGILELLSLRLGVTVTKEMFLDHLYGGKDEPKLKIIDVFICHLRKKLAQATNGKHYIETVWGRGYRLCAPVQALPIPDCCAKFVNVAKEHRDKKFDSVFPPAARPRRADEQSA